MVTRTEQTLPPPYVTALGEQFAGYMADPSAAGYKDIRESDFYVDPSSFTGKGFVAGQDPLTSQAQTLGQGLGGYQQYLTDAQGFQTGAADYFTDRRDVADPFMTSAGQYTDLMGQAAAAGQDAGAQYMGPDAYKQFMSPYQQQVIDASMAAYNQQVQEQQAKLGSSAGSAFGGGRFGVAQGQLGADAALGGANLQAGLLSQGFQQANQAAARAFQQANAQALQNQQMYGSAAAGQQGMAQQSQQQLANTLAQYGGLGASSMGLGNYAMSGLGNQINALSQMGAQNQALEQARLDAQRQGLQAQAYAPQQGLGFMGQMIGAAQGMPGGTTFQTTPDPSTMQTLLGAGTGILGILGASGYFNKNQGN
jgi:hypothetical protein